MSSCWKAKLVECSISFCLTLCLTSTLHSIPSTLICQSCCIASSWVGPMRTNQNGEEGEPNIWVFLLRSLATFHGVVVTLWLTHALDIPHFVGSPGLLYGKATLWYTSATNSWFYQSFQPRYKIWKLSHTKLSMSAWSLPEYDQVRQLIPSGSK